MAPSDSRSVNRCGHAHLACKFPINVTVPVEKQRDAAQLEGCRIVLGILRGHSRVEFASFGKLANLEEPICENRCPGWLESDAACAAKLEATITTSARQILADFIVDFGVRRARRPELYQKLSTWA